MRIAVVMGAVIEEQLNVWIACSELGVDITIIGTDKNIYTKDWPWQPKPTERVRCILLRPVSPALNRGHLLWVYRGIGSSLRRLRPDLIHVESEPWGGLTLQTLLITRLFRLGIPVYVHGADNVYWHGSWLEQSIRRMVLRLTLPQLAGFISWNRDGVLLAEQAGLNSSTPSRVIPGVVPDPEVFYPPTLEQRTSLRRKFGLPLGEPIVAYIGRLVEQKGVQDLVEALKRPEAGRPFLAVWGSGPLANTVEAVFSTGELRGRFGGALDRPDVADALRAVDIIVVPSRTTSEWREQFGRVVLEGMFSGCTVVSYASGAIPEVVGEGGILVQEGHIEELASVVGGLLSDEASRLDVARSGRDQALARFHPRTVARQVIDFWSEAVSDT